jgi:hypothetical protein
MTQALFCLISAIGNNYGIFSYKERYNQLLGSIESIRKYAPDSDIVIFDASEDALPKDDVKQLRSLVNYVHLLNNDKYVQFLKYNSKDPTPNKFEKKTVGEMQAMVAFLDFLKDHPKQYQRVFKLTGRLKLNENFNMAEFLKHKNRLVLQEKENWFGKDVFRIRLWSFDYDNLNEIRNLFYTMQKHTYDLLIEKQELELIEYTFTKFIHALNIPYANISVAGISGMKGYDAIEINE